jgi:hypothetical protein
MKRRARRVLRHLSKQNPIYIFKSPRRCCANTARKHSTLRQTGRQWMCVSPTARAGSKRSRDARLQKCRWFCALRREERAPEIGTRIRRGYKNSSRHNVPLEANEMALKALRANKLEQPALDARSCSVSEQQFGIATKRSDTRLRRCGSKRPANRRRDVGAIGSQRATRVLGVYC